MKNKFGQELTVGSFVLFASQGTSPSIGVGLITKVNEDTKRVKIDRCSWFERYEIPGRVWEEKMLKYSGWFFNIHNVLVISEQYAKDLLPENEYLTLFEIYKKVMKLNG